MLMRFDPFRDFDRLTQQLRGGVPGGRVAGMPMDAYREGDHFTVHFDLPGVEPGSVELTVDRHVLTVRAERNSSRAEGSEVVAAERPQGTFARRLFLGDGLDTSRIEATHENGVLTVRIPVAEQAKPRRIEVSGQQGSEATPAGPSEEGAPRAA